MKDSEARYQFINLRAQNKSFDFISNELKISKTTLLSWSKEYQYEISNLKTVQLEELKEKYLITKEQRLKVFKALVEKIEQEISIRNFTDMPTEKLIDYYNVMTAKANGEIRLELSENVGFKVQGMGDTIEKWSI